MMILLIALVVITVISLMAINANLHSNQESPASGKAVGAQSENEQPTNGQNVDEQKESGQNTKDSLEGTFRYNESVKYEFGKNGKGAMYNGNDKYEYTYTVDETNIKMDFQKENIMDATYRYILEGDTLTLFGAEGTTGGKYILEKENK